MTGEFEWRVGYEHGVTGIQRPFVFDLSKASISSRLKEKGYNTAYIGKWHMGFGNDDFISKFSEKLTPGPNDIGYDYFFGLPHFHDDVLGAYIENDMVKGIVSSESELPVDQRVPDGFVNHKGKRTYNGIHFYAPFRDPYKTTDMLNEVTHSWIDKQSSDVPFFLFFAPSGVRVPYMPAKRFQGTTGGGAYSDFLLEVDSAVGKLVYKLEEKGMAENTVFILTSDNGGAKAKGELRKTYNKLHGNYKGGKLSIYEGGFKVPLIIKWPNKIEAGTYSNELINLSDIYATVMEIVKVKMDEPLYEAGDSFSFYDALFKNLSNPIRDKMIYTSYEGVKAIQVDGWKYTDGHARLKVGRGKKYDTIPHLFNLKEDPFEQNDLISQFPEKAKELSDLIELDFEQGYSRKP